MAMTQKLRGAFPVEPFSARNRLLLALTVILATSFVGTSLINYTITSSAIRREILQKDLPLTRDNIYSDLSAELSRPILVASSMAVDAFLKEWVARGEQDEHMITEYLREIRDRYGFFSVFFVSEQTGNYYHFNGLHKVISPEDDHDVWYYSFRDRNKDYELDVDNDQAAANNLTVFINYRVEGRDGKLLGVTGVGLQVQRLAELIADYQHIYDRSIYLTDGTGLIQVHQDQTLIEKQSITGMEGLAPLAGKILATGEDPENFRFSRQGQAILLTVRHLGQLNWLLFVEQNETTALHQARMNLLRTVLIGLVASLVIIGLTLFTINRFQERLEVMATIDALTGVANRRMLEIEFSRFLSLQHRQQQSFSLILVDLDGFKKVNDTLGHMSGDMVLRQVADIIAATVRPTEVVARWGGDEFIVLTPLGVAEAALVARRLAAAVAATDLAGAGTRVDDPRKKITISSGITEYVQGDDLDGMITRADQAMYSSKKEGGNRISTLAAT
jgi:diguanylate cyclase (GGDEF)-like protein